MNKQQALENYITTVIAYKKAESELTNAHKELIAIKNKHYKANENMTLALRKLEEEIIKERGGI